MYEINYEREKARDEHESRPEGQIAGGREMLRRKTCLKSREAWTGFAVQLI